MDQQQFNKIISKQRKKLIKKLEEKDHKYQYLNVDTCGQQSSPQDLPSGKTNEFIEKDSDPSLEYYKFISKHVSLKISVRICGKPNSIELSEALTMLEYDPNKDIDLDLYNKYIDEINSILKPKDQVKFNEYIIYLRENNSNVMKFLEKILNIDPCDRLKYVKQFITYDLEDIEDNIYNIDQEINNLTKIIGKSVCDGDTFDSIVTIETYQEFVKRLRKCSKEDMEKIYRLIQNNFYQKDVDKESYRKYVYLCFVDYINSIRKPSSKVLVKSNIYNKKIDLVDAFNY